MGGIQLGVQSDSEEWATLSTARMGDTGLPPDRSRVADCTRALLGSGDTAVSTAAGGAGRGFTHYGYHPPQCVSRSNLRSVIGSCPAAELGRWADNQHNVVVAMARMMVIYQSPTDPQSFDAHYEGVHIPLAKRLPGLRRYDVARRPIVLPAGDPEPYLIATLHFDDLAAQEPNAEPREELFLALGHLVFAFGQLDEVLHDAMWMALGRRSETRILTSGLRFPQLVERFRAIYADFHDPISGSEGVAELCTELNALNEERNREVHSVWGFWANSGRPVRAQRGLRRGSLSLKMETVEPAELLELAGRMDKATEKVWEVVLDYERDLGRQPH